LKFKAVECEAQYNIQRLLLDFWKLYLKQIIIFREIKAQVL